MALNGLLISLNSSDRAYALDVARRRQELAEKKRRKDGTGSRDRAYQLRMHENGCLAELAAKYAFDPIKWNDFTEDDDLDSLPDLEGNGYKIDVKGITDDRHRLLIPEDNLHPDRCYVLVLLGRPCEVVGWIPGCDIRPSDLCEPQPGRPAYAIKQDELEEPDTLREWIHAQRQTALL